MMKWWGESVLLLACDAGLAGTHELSATHSIHFLIDLWVLTSCSSPLHPGEKCWHLGSHIPSPYFHRNLYLPVISFFIFNFSLSIGSMQPTFKYLSFFTLTTKVFMVSSAHPSGVSFPAQPNRKSYIPLLFQSLTFQFLFNPL